MVITAKYNGKCSKCGGRIRAGEQIEWAKGAGASHISCPIAESKAVIEDKSKPDASVITIYGGSGYGCRGWDRGDVVKGHMDHHPEFLFVLNAGSDYYREDGLSFGVGDDRGHVYWAQCREATTEEAAPLRAEMAQRAQVKAAKKRVHELSGLIRKTGEMPERSKDNACGERLLDTVTIYGGGDWFVIAEDAIWYVQNNGADGDCWDANNVMTGGAGAIGWRVAYDNETADELRSLDKVLSR